ncbi:MAG TPA: signal peptidase I [Pyrinomonadaceae bacterium]|jgi:signal peptidase I|nr:signal peptidase I [Pyrinomonadaceae bacterium]
MFKRKRQRAPAFGDIGVEDDRDIEVRRPQQESRQHFWAEARLLLRDLIFALMIAALFVVFIVQPVKVEGTSMLPRLHDGERIFVNKLVYYGLPKLERGDIVVFWFPDDPSKSYIKRVIGLPGETVQVRDNHILINGRELSEPYLDPSHNVAPYGLRPDEFRQGGAASGGSVYISPHYYFVMGDNRDNSSDSRMWGLVPEKYIYGKALYRYWPLSDASVIRHETDYPGIPRRDIIARPDAEEDVEP